MGLDAGLSLILDVLSQFPCLTQIIMSAQQDVVMADADVRSQQYFHVEPSLIIPLLIV
jgi:hypothetical protein